MDAHKTIQSIFHILGILVILGFLALQGAGCMIMVSAMGDSAGSVSTGSEAEDEFLFGDESAETHFLRIPIEGIILNQPEERFPGLSEESMPARTHRLIDHARKSDEIAGILVDIDSPGGAVDPSDVIYHQLMRFREESGKPVVARLRGVAASGGYYIASAADLAIAHPSCITGSIGVIIQSMNMRGLFDKLGLELLTLTSGPNKDLLNPGREMSDEERAILMTVVDDAYGNFVRAIVEGREMDEGLVRELGDGRIYTAAQALENGLIDEIGYEEELLEILRDLSASATVDVVSREEPTSLLDVLGLEIRSLFPSSTPEQILGMRTSTLREAGLYYLWEPGL
ncbi:MAG: signal peptide peptidase SppA [Candidatus Krumholzibacteria bacterium]|nr:signal peptide peptidase SppA [Candidatus Krumholzibacteria bacterium]MDP6797566.1 signal peptide peptidase SppA [Candidatus Krumholzibacteria bacterium]MDP7021241.1 signal peptide peptidase SppA [Candidatus Krumholzibacteria bacterium]